jgi:hypothetical protein
VNANRALHAHLASEPALVEAPELHLGSAGGVAELTHLRFAAAGLGQQVGDEVALAPRVQRARGRVGVEPAAEARGREHLGQPFDDLVVVPSEILQGVQYV